MENDNLVRMLNDIIERLNKLQDAQYEMMVKVTKLETKDMINDSSRHNGWERINLIAAAVISAAISAVVAFIFKSK